jgi:hypothetical protein
MSTETCEVDVLRGMCDIEGRRTLGGKGGHFGAPHYSVTVLEGRHGFAGALRTLGGKGGHFGAPDYSVTVLEGRHGFAGALRTSGG